MVDNTNTISAPLNSQEGLTPIATGDTTSAERAQEILDSILNMGSNYETIFGLIFRTPTNNDEFEKNLQDYIAGTKTLDTIKDYVVTAQDYSTLRDNLVGLLKQLQNIENGIFNGDELTYSQLYDRINTIEQNLAQTVNSFNEAYNNGSLKIDINDFKITRENLFDEYNNPLTYAGTPVKYVSKADENLPKDGTCYYIQEI